MFECELGLFLQTDGTPMGAPLSCILADVFLENYEGNINFHHQSIQIGADWFRYRDDTWMIWEYSLEVLQLFLTYLNSLHPNIKWTHEIEQNGIMSFLDVLVKRETDGSVTTSVYRKKTHSDRYLHFSSDHPLKDKIACLETLRCRAFAYCSSETLVKAELLHLQKVFIENGYPTNLVLQFLSLRKRKEKKQKKKDLETQEEFFCGYLTVPYDKLLNDPLKKLCNSLNIGFLNKRKVNLGNLISPKRPPSDLLNSKNCVYKIPCAEPNCPISYIGESKRRNKTRFAEHIKVCKNLKTKKKFIQSEKNDTGLPYHVFMTGHSFNFENAEILCQESNWRKRKLLEALHIELTPNTCNLHKGKSFDNNWLTFLKYFKTLDNTSEVCQFQENR